MEIATIKNLAKKLNLQNLANGCFELKETAMSNLDYLQFVLQKELSMREDRQVDKRQKASKLPIVKFDDNQIGGITKWQFNELMKLQWIENDENLMLIGSCNTGKTAIATMIANEAIIQGHKVYYIKIDTFLIMIKTKESIPKAKTIWSYISECQMIIIDEVLYTDITREDLQLLYKAIIYLNETHSLIIISNREISDWLNACEDKHLMKTMLDRITAHTQILRTDKLEPPTRKTLKKEVKKI